MKKKKELIEALKRVLNDEKLGPDERCHIESFIIRAEKEKISLKELLALATQIFKLSKLIKEILG